MPTDVPSRAQLQSALRAQVFCLVVAGNFQRLKASGSDKLEQPDIWTYSIVCTIILSDQLCYSPSQSNTSALSAAFATTVQNLLARLHCTAARALVPLGTDTRPLHFARTFKNLRQVSAVRC
jgi:hypothetical protein